MSGDLGRIVESERRNARGTGHGTWSCRGASVEVTAGTWSSGGLPQGGRHMKGRPLLEYLRLVNKR